MAGRTGERPPGRRRQQRHGRHRHALANCRMMVKKVQKGSSQSMKNLMIYPIKSTIYKQVLRIC